MKMSALFLFTFLLTISFISCAGPKDLLGTKELVPSNFGKLGDGILVIETDKNSINKDLEQGFSKYYTGAFKLIPYEEINNYDISKYPLTFHTEKRITDGHGLGDSRTSGSIQYSFYVMDRQVRKKYGPTNLHIFVDQLLKPYVKKLEEVKNSNK